MQNFFNLTFFVLLAAFINSKNVIYEEGELHTKRKNILLAVTGKYKHIIEDKNTKAWAVEKKTNAWENIVQEFNCLAESGVRSAKQLKILYDNLKRETRKRVAQENHERYEAKLKEVEAKKAAAHEKREIRQTGGGTSSLEMTSEQEIILATMREQVKPLETACDSAAEYFNDVEMFEMASPNPELSCFGPSTILPQSPPAELPSAITKRAPTLPRRPRVRPRKNKKIIVQRHFL